LSRFSYVSNGTTRETDAKVNDIEDAVTPPTKRRRKLSEESPIKAIKAEANDELLADVPPKAAAPSRKQRKPARKATDPDTGETTMSPPSDWERMYELVRKMRAPGGIAYGAAVDTMGCERLADREASPKDQRFHTLVALMLSSQTKDTTNAAAMKRLKTELPPHKPGAPAGLNLDNMLAVEPKLLNELIWAVGFHNNKTK
jgi:endonuclease-3